MKSPLKIRWHRHFAGVPTTVTISKDSANRYFVSFSVEEEIKQLPKNNEQVAIDLGIKDVIGYLQKVFPLAILNITRSIKKN